MGLVVKHVERARTGSFQYRRRVPKDVAGIIAKREFKRKLGETQKEALATYPHAHAAVEREIEEARRRLALSDAASLSSASEREAYAEALRRRADLIASEASEEELSLVADQLADSYPQHGWEPVGVPPLERNTINLLRLGPERYKAPEPKLGDALKLYRKEHLREDDQGTDSRVVKLARVTGAAINALGRDPMLTALTREDARKVRDEMLDRVKVRGRGIGGRSIRQRYRGSFRSLPPWSTSLRSRSACPTPFRTPSTSCGGPGSQGIWGEESRQARPAAA